MNTTDSLPLSQFEPGDTMEIPGSMVEEVRRRVSGVRLDREEGNINDVIQRISMLHEGNYSTLKALYRHIQNIKGEIDEINNAKADIEEGEKRLVLAQSEFQFQFIPFKIQLYKYAKCGRYELNVTSAQLN